MNFRHAIVSIFAITTALYLGACSLEAAMATCAQCGEIRSIAPRPMHANIRLVTDAPLPVPERLDGAPMVYDVRIHMDRGGSRDFVVAERPRARVGERVEVRNGLIVPLAGSLFQDGWT
jgi:hypothetical protein